MLHRPIALGASLGLPMGLITLAIAWAARAAKDLLGTRWPRRKPHGHLEKSWFRTGFNRIRNLRRSDPLNAVAPSPRGPVGPLRLKPPANL